MRRGTSRGEPRGGGVSPWTPKKLSPIAWFRADLGITLNGSNVSAWADQSGYGKNLSQSTAGLQPTYVASDSSYASKPVLSISSDLMATASFTLVAQPVSILFIGQSDVVNGNIVDGGAVHRCVLYTGPGTSWSIYSGSSVDSTSPSNTPSRVLAEFSGVNSKIFVGSLASPVKTGNAATLGIDMITIGDYVGGGGSATGKIAELVTFNRVLTAAEKARLEAYTLARYGF